MVSVRVGGGQGSRGGSISGAGDGGGRGGGGDHLGVWTAPRSMGSICNTAWAAVAFTSGVAGAAPPEELVVRWR